MRGKILWSSLALLFVLAVAALWGREWFASPPLEVKLPAAKSPGPLPAGHELATFGGGCFWCTEAVFQQLKGVASVVSGYSGGTKKNPTYEQVCSGTTGHAEVIQIGYDPALVPFETLLAVFWKTHDPTTLNRQGGDTGTQYRSVIFYHNATQRDLAVQYKKKLDAACIYSAPIVTEIAPYTEFYAAEEYHQDYYATHPQQAYCWRIIGPKLKKFQEVFKDKLK